MSRFLDAYRSQDPALMVFYAQTPEQLFTAPTKAPKWSPAMVKALQRYQRELGLERHIQGNEWVIVTGQQPGLFTGPLYTIYKAITAIKLAESCSAKTGVPHLPVYWVASDDHDFEEVRNSHFLTRFGALHRHRYTPASEDPKDWAELPMFRMPLEESMHEVVEELSRVTRNTASGDSVRELLHDTLNDASSLSDWHARLMAALFRDTPLCIFSPHLEAARKEAKPILAHEIATPLASTVLVNVAGEALTELGYEAQVVKAEDECNFFVFIEGKRRKVLFRDGQYRIPATQLNFSPDVLGQLLEKHPEDFSPNVALRCVVQQRLFPTRSYVAGPGELAYWAQLNLMFNTFNYPMPVVYPRAQACLIPEKVARLRSHYALESADFTQPYPALLEAALDALPPLSSQEDFHRHQDALRAQVHSMLEAIQRSSPSQRRGQQKAQRFANAFEHHMGKLERGLLRGDVERNQQVHAHLIRLVNVLAPYQKPQERVLNIFSFLFEHGLELIPTLLDALEYDAAETQEIVL